MVRKVMKYSDLVNLKLSNVSDRVITMARSNVAPVLCVTGTTGQVRSGGIGNHHHPHPPQQEGAWECQALTQAPRMATAVYIVINGLLAPLSLSYITAFILFLVFLSVFFFHYFALYCTLVMNSVDASSLRGWRVALAGGQELVMNSVDAAGLTSVTSETTVEPLDDTGGGGGVGDSVGTQITSDDDDDEVPSSPGSFGEDEGSMPITDDVTAQLAAAGGWAGEREHFVFVVVEGANARCSLQGRHTQGNNRTC
ncbi:hypothetical protein E2C01_010517 [Portunus trituberculatus]|uniref:Uncharacterized protein n=1 Tax=Portunus trituberculatus TaxID=210409 RepID=A0A5B7D8N6_PORTR|nr:hypothetical protein [Portunus trituberculatus]